MQNVNTMTTTDESRQSLDHVSVMLGAVVYAGGCRGIYRLVGKESVFEEWRS